MKNQQPLDTPLARSRKATEEMWNKDRKIVYNPEVERRIALIQKYGSTADLSRRPRLSFLGKLLRLFRGY